MDTEQLKAKVETLWNDDIIPTLAEYISIPNKSPDFDPQWVEHGHMENVVQLFAGWANSRPVKGMKLEIVRLEGRTPLIYIEVEGTGNETTLLYGHLDKQPEMIGWDEGKGPWQPVLEDDKLYGRGGADDGYALFAALSAIEAMQAQELPHPRCIILIEAGEESGSPDLPAYIEHLADRIGIPKLVICLDSGCGNYDQLWCTTSLRGNLTGTLEVELISEGVHSGDGSGVVASSFRVARALLSRIEDENTGEILIPELDCEVPGHRIEQAATVAEVLGDEAYKQYPLLPGVDPTTYDGTELVLRRTWRATLSVTGADGFPPVKDAGNVLRPKTSFKLSLRLPPTVDAATALKKVKSVLEADPPYGAKTHFIADGPANGWDSPALAPWLESSLKEASLTFFGKPVCYMGEGGSIPFMAMLGDRFPQAQFLITGVLGPQSNAHGPNEFLHLPTAKRLTACVAKILADQRAQSA